MVVTTSLGTLIGTDELAQIRTDLQASYGATCEVLRPQPIEQRRGRSGGLSVRPTPDLVALVPCRTAPDFMPPAERATGGGVAALRPWVVYVAPEVDVRPGDQLRITDAATLDRFTVEVVAANPPRLPLDLEKTVRCQEIGTAPPTPPAVPLST